MNKDDRLAKIHLFISGQLGGSDLEEFELWMNEAPEHKAEVASVRDVWLKSELYRVPEFDPMSALGEMPFDSRKNRMLRTGWVRITSAAAIVLLLTVSGVLYTYMNPDTTTVLGSESSYIVLDDGTEVYLREDATITFPTKFRGRSRIVELDGEAFFDVFEDDDRPFSIETDLTIIRVTGTSFSVEENDALGIVEVHVSEGSVELSPRLSRASIQLRERESARYEDATGILDRYVGDQNELAWHTRSLVFDNTPLSEVVSDLKDAYGVDIDLSRCSAINCHFTSPKPHINVPVRQILESISLILNTKLSIDSNISYALIGGNC